MIKLYHERACQGRVIHKERSRPLIILTHFGPDIWINSHVYSVEDLNEASKSACSASEVIAASFVILMEINGPVQFNQSMDSHGFSALSFLAIQNVATTR